MASHNKYATLLNKRGRDALPLLPQAIGQYAIQWSIGVINGNEEVLIGTYKLHTFVGRDVAEATRAVDNYIRGLKDAQ